MAHDDIRTISDWLHGRKTSQLKFSALWKIILIRIADRAYDLVDEEGHSIRSLKKAYSYDLSLIIEEDNIKIRPQELHRAALYLHEHGFATLSRRSPPKLILTREGMEEAENILGQISDIGDPVGRLDPPDQIPAADRFVRLDDNSQTFTHAISSLERLISEMHEIRINDWPEKEGMLAATKATLEMIRTKYVNRRTLLAAISPVATFIIVKFAEVPISDLANAAWTAVKNLF